MKDTTPSTSITNVIACVSETIITEAANFSIFVKSFSLLFIIFLILTHFLEWIFSIVRIALYVRLHYCRSPHLYNSIFWVTRLVESEPDFVRVFVAAVMTALPILYTHILHSFI